MVAEHELLEQVLDEAWPLERAVGFMVELGRDGWMVVLRLWEDGMLAVEREGGDALVEWEVRRAVRERRTDGLQVRCTDKGAALVV